MAAPVLATKLFIPPHRSGLVSRSRLGARLNECLAPGRKLALISAPAGFGKTTLVSEWIATSGTPTAWLSLDEGDHAPSRFLTYLVAALQTLSPRIGEGLLVALQSPQPPPTESLLGTLLNDISAFGGGADLPDPFVLVLDDYHVVDSTAVDEDLSFLLEHLPPRMRLVIATREDPRLHLARLRARRQLTELRAADLRFTAAEAAEFLNRVAGLNLNETDVAALEARTEGWIAGLQLAALSMQGRSDAAGFIQAFAGSHRFVLDYLVEEVLDRQPERVRRFLLQTAILDRLNGSLCDAVTAQEGGRELLDTLERGNLFVVPLDDQRQWYRYHHLFADVLQAHLTDTGSERISRLHQRASAWFEQNGFPPDAIRHALAAGDFERAAGLIELARPSMNLSYQSTIWLGWAKALPDGLVRARPVLSVGYAWALLDAGELEASEARLQAAECWLDTPTNQMVVVDKEQFRTLPASIATARAYRSLALGDIPGTIKYARQGLELTPEDAQTRHNEAIALLGLAQYSNGDLEAAERSLADLHADLRKTGEIVPLVGITFLLAGIRLALGHLHEAESCYQQTLHLANGAGKALPLGIADLYRGLGDVCMERGDLEAAARQVLASQKLGEQTATTDWLHRLCVSKARLREALGDLDGALALLDEAERVTIRVPLPDIYPVAALKARVWLKQGRLVDALRWAHEQGLTVDDDIHYAHEFEHITLARVLIASGKGNRDTGSLNEAIRLLVRLQQAAESGSRLGSVIQILLLQALAFQAQECLPRALSLLERALALAESEGFVRIFVDEGEALRLLLREFVETPSRHQGDPLRVYAGKLLVAFAQLAATPAPAGIPQRSDLIEPLSERELDVLKLLQSELGGPDIAKQLIVSLHTLRTHTDHIFKKLGVNNRRSAVRRAQELGLL